MHRRLAQLLLIACGGLLVWGVAPALSTRAYVPPAVDFEQRLPGLERAGRAAGGSAGGGLRRHDHDGRPREADGGEGHGRSVWVSPPIEAPGRFDLVGLGGELRPLELRTRAAGEGWSKWVRTQAGDPVWAGGAKWVQLRSRGFEASGRLHYVNVSGDATSRDEMVNGLRGAVNGAVISVAGLIASPAQASPPRPRVVRRGQWGARRDEGGCKPRTSPAYGRVSGSVVHHTVTTNSYSAREASDVVLGICRYHRNGNGWNDIGYNFLVDRFGRIYVGRAGGGRRPVVGAHSQGFNSQTTGVAAIGDFTSRHFTRRMRRSLIRLLAWKHELHGIRAGGRTYMVSGGGSSNRYARGERVRVPRISAHRRLSPTACPGDTGLRFLRNLRRYAQRFIDRHAARPDEPSDPPPDDEDDEAGTGDGSTDGSGDGTSDGSTDQPAGGTADEPSGEQSWTGGVRAP